MIVVVVVVIVYSCRCRYVILVTGEEGEMKREEERERETDERERDRETNNEPHPTTHVIMILVHRMIVLFVRKKLFVVADVLCMHILHMKKRAMYSTHPSSLLCTVGELFPLHYVDSTTVSDTEMRCHYLQTRTQ